MIKIKTNNGQIGQVVINPDSLWGSSIGIFDKIIDQAGFKLLRDKNTEEEFTLVFDDIVESNSTVDQASDIVAFSIDHVEKSSLEYLVTAIAQREVLMLRITGTGALQEYPGYWQLEPEETLTGSPIDFRIKFKAKVISVMPHEQFSNTISALFMICRDRVWLDRI
jgi:hypothetical protein